MTIFKYFQICKQILCAIILLIVFLCPPVCAENRALPPVFSILLRSPTDSLPSKPAEHNTGPISDENELIQSSSIVITVDGSVIENLYIEGNVNVKADNVTIRNCIIDTDSFYGIRANYGNTGLLVEDVEIKGMRSAGIMGSNFTLRRANIHDSGGDAVKPFNNVLIENSWMHRLGYLEGSHSDGVQMVVGENVEIKGNNIDMPYDLPGFTSSQCIIIQTNIGPVDNVLIEDNWLNGGGYCVHVRDKGNGYDVPTNVRIINNKFGRDYQFGIWVLEGEVIRFGNIWEDTGEPVE